MQWISERDAADGMTHHALVLQAGYGADTVFGGDGDDLIQGWGALAPLDASRDAYRVALLKIHATRIHVWDGEDQGEVPVG